MNKCQCGLYISDIHAHAHADEAHFAKSERPGVLHCQDSHPCGRSGEAENRLFMLTDLQVHQIYMRTDLLYLGAKEQIVDGCTVLIRKEVYEKYIGK